MWPGQEREPVAQASTCRHSCAPLQHAGHSHKRALCLCGITAGSEPAPALCWAVSPTCEPHMDLSWGTWASEPCEVPLLPPGLSSPSLGAQAAASCPAQPSPVADSGAPAECSPGAPGLPQPGWGCAAWSGSRSPDLPFCASCCLCLDAITGASPSSPRPALTYQAPGLQALQAGVGQAPVTPGFSAS